jgi:hypothetical protein
MTGSVAAVVAARLQPTTVSASYDARSACDYFGPGWDTYGDTDDAHGDMERAVGLAEDAARKDRRYQGLRDDVRTVRSALPTTQSGPEVQRAKRDCRELGFD